MKKLKTIVFVILTMIPIYNMVERYYPNQIWTLPLDEQVQFGMEHGEEIIRYLHKDYPRVWKLTTYFYPEIKEFS